MLTRRYLRIKVMQSLYAFFQSENNDLGKGERELLNSIDKMYELYAYLLSMLVSLREIAAEIIDENKLKRLPTPENLNPNLRFVNNRFLLQLEANNALRRECDLRKISWNSEKEFVKKVFNQIRAGEEYDKYMNASPDTYKADQDFINDIFRAYLSEHELLHHFLGERNIHWGDDVWFVNMAVVRTIESFVETSDASFSLLPLYKDEDDDKKFALELFRKTILTEKDTEKMISEKTQNWEVERIAMMDVLLMKMALTELVAFSGIPVKVTLNEYIEISKMFSTPKSKMFINGILDKLVIDLKKDQKIVKVGRGLME